MNAHKLGQLPILICILFRGQKYGEAYMTLGKACRFRADETRTAYRADLRLRVVQRHFGHCMETSRTRRGVSGNAARRTRRGRHQKSTRYYAGRRAPLPPAQADDALPQRPLNFLARRSLPRQCFPRMAPPAISAGIA